MFHTPTSQPLFIQHKSAAELLSKEAAAIARMPDDDKRWPAQVLSEIHKQLPFMSKYDVDIEMTRVEPEAGYALGYAILRNKTGRQRAEEQLGKPTNKLRVPVIVADRMLQPFHVFEIGGKVYPLTQDRVESAMMNPAMFDGAADPPGTRSLLDQIYPPFQHRQGYGMMGGDRATQGVSKLSSAPSTNKVATVALAIPLTSDNDRSTQQLRYAHEDLKERKPRHLLNALGGGAAGAVFGGLAGHAIADHAAFSGGKSLMTTGRGAALGAALGAAALPAGVAAYRKHRMSELDRQLALRGRVDSSASKSASGELGPLREFLREAEVEKRAATLVNQGLKRLGQKFVSGVERKGAQALVGTVKPPTLPHAPPPGNAGGFMPRSATTSAAMHAPAPAARPAAAPPVAPRPAAPAPTPTAAPAAAAPIPPTAGAPVAPANPAATDVNLAASMTPQQAQAINAGAPPTPAGGRRGLREIKAEQAARASTPEGIQKQVQQARGEATQAAESKANVARVKERMAKAQQSAADRQAAEAAKPAPAPAKSQPAYNERAAREQAQAATQQQQAHQAAMQNPQARRAYLESKGLNPDMTAGQYQTLNSNYEVARQATPNLTMDQFVAANPNTVGRNVLFGQGGSGLGVGAVPVRPGAAPAAPAAEAAAGGKSLAPYLAGAAVIGGGAYLANKATDTVSQY